MTVRDAPMGTPETVHFSHLSNEHNSREIHESKGNKNINALNLKQD